MASAVSSASGAIRLTSTKGRWVLAATVLGSSMAMLDGTVVNVALPTLGKSLHTALAACSGRSPPTRSPSPG